MEEQKFRQAIFTDGVFQHWHYWGFIKEHENLTFVAPEMGLSSIKKAHKNCYQCVDCLKDKDGRGVYEGDVLKDNYGRILLVEWYKYGFSFKAITVTNFLRARDISQWFETGGTLPGVIGNIVENPELVEGVVTDA